MSTMIENHDLKQQLTASQARCAELEGALISSDEGLKAWLHMYAATEVDEEQRRQYRLMIQEQGGTLVYLAGLFKVNRQLLTPTERPPA